MKTLVPFLLLVIIFACDRNKNLTNADEMIKIDLLSGADTTLSNLSVIASEIEYIPLQTIDSSLIGRIDKVIITDDNIYINDRGMAIVCFDREGRFVSRLSNVGRGPGEYTFINDFDISSDSERLIILTSGKILVYNINDNEFIFSRYIDTSSGALKVAFIRGTHNILLSNGPWHGDETTLNLVIDMDSDTLLFKPNCYMYENSGEGFFSANDAMQYKLGDKVCFKEAFSDTIFYADSKLDGISPHLILDSHGTVPPPRLREDREYRNAHANDFSSVAVVYEVPRYIFYYYMYRSKRHKIIYDKVSKTKYELDLETGLKDDLYGGTGMDLNMQNCTGTYFYATVDAFEFKQYIQSDDFYDATVKYPVKQEGLEVIAGSMKETDNPLLIVVTPKD